MKNLFSKEVVMSLCVGMALFALCLTSAHAVFINEIHYDNTGGDVGEGVELTGLAGEDLSGWSLLLYNGNNGTVYNNVALGGVFTNMQQGMGVLDFAVSGIQNGSPDGIALVSDTGNVLQFLSYEGSMTANAGAAAGLTSIDIGVAENSSTLVGSSLQLLGSGRDYADFFWGAGINTFGVINGNQTFVAPLRQTVAPVPEPSSGLLLLFGLLLLGVIQRMRNAMTVIMPAH